jgi:hypothetical protein
MTDTNNHQFWISRLMEHMTVLCKEIGPRASTSREECMAAGYVEQTLKKLGQIDIQRQDFRSHTSMGWITIPILAIASLAIPLAWAGGLWGKFVAGLFLIASSYTFWKFLQGKQPFFQTFVAHGTSQNIIAKIPPSGRVNRKVYLIGHLDSQKQRYLTPPPITGMLPINSTLLIVVPFLGGMALFLDILINRQAITWCEWLVGTLLFLTLLSVIVEEKQPYVEGANDNASAVSVLLTVAEFLRARPMQHTEVTFIFTGCEEAICVGMENFLRQYKPPKANTYWIDLEMVGSGNLCYVTRHGVSYLTRYYPAPELLDLAEQTARKHPELGVTGKQMIILEEVANLRNRRYNAICLAGYNEKGYLANWHRLSDNLDNIEPDTLLRANLFTLALLQEIDGCQD